MESLPANGLQSDFTMKFIEKTSYISSYISTYFLQKNWIYYIPLNCFQEDFPEYFHDDLWISWSIALRKSYFLLSFKSIWAQRRRRCHYVKYSHFGTLTVRSHRPVCLPPSLYIALWTHRLTRVSTWLVELHYPF